MVEKAIQVLEVLSRHSAPFTLPQLARETGQPKSSVYRVLLTWEKLGYVERVGPDVRFRLGMRALQLSRNVAARNRLNELTRSLLVRLHEKFHESVYLGLYRKQQVILIDAIEGTHPLRVVVDLGETCYLHASAQGRSVAAYLTPDCLAGILRETGFPRVTRKTDTDPVHLPAALQEVREQGYAINWEETVEGCVCVAVPYFAGSDGPVLGSLGVSIPVSRVTEELLAKVTEEMKAVGVELSNRLVGFAAEPETLPRRAAPPFLTEPGGRIPARLL